MLDCGGMTPHSPTCLPDPSAELGQGPALSADSKDPSRPPPPHKKATEIAATSPLLDHFGLISSVRKPAAVPARTVVRRIIPQSRSTIALGRAAGIPGPRLCPLRTSRSNVQIAGIARFFEILAKETGSSSSPTGLGNPPLGGGGRTPDSVFDGA